MRFTVTLTQRIDVGKVTLEMGADTYKEAALMATYPTYDAINYCVNVRYEVMDNTTGEIVLEGVRYGIA